MTPTKQRERFTELQTKARAASDAVRAYAIDLRVKYGDGYYRGWCGKAENRRLDVLQRVQTRAMDRLFAFLDTIQTRQFRSGVPCHWIVDKLTFDDATTTGAMSEVPPPVYGCTQYDSRRFASCLGLINPSQEVRRVTALGYLPVA